MFLSRMSVSIFGFTVSQVLLHTHGWGMLETYPEVVVTNQGLLVLFFLVLSATIFILYWGWSWWQEKRKVWVDQSKIKYLLVGAIDCAIGTLPYVSYVATLYLLDALKLW